MKIRKAARLANEGKRIRRALWNLGTYCLADLSTGDIVFYDAAGRLQGGYSINIDDILAEDWMEVWSETK